MNNSQTNNHLFHWENYLNYIKATLNFITVTKKKEKKERTEERKKEKERKRKTKRPLQPQK